MALQIDKPAEFIRLDLFPTKIVDTFSGKNLGEEFRVIITNDHVYFFIDGGVSPKIFFDAPLVDFSKEVKIGYIVETEDNIYEISRASNCGCGTSLRGFYPFLGVPYRRQV